MASGIYGRRVVDNHISDHALFAQDQYPVTGANRVLTNELESVWDKVNDAKAVLQKLEHRIETSEESKKAEDLALSLNEAGSYKKTPAKSNTRHLSSSLRGGQSTIQNRSVGHKVAFNEPLVSYREEFDPLHGSTTGAVSNLGSTIPDSSKSFIAMDLRTNDFDLSRVTVRSKSSSTPIRSTRTEDNDKLSNGVSGQDNAEHDGSLLKGTVIPTRVLNNHLSGQRNDKAVRRGRDLKAAGVATTVTHFDPDQVYKYLQMEGIRKASENTGSQSAYPAASMEQRSPLFLGSPYAPYKRIDVVKQRKKMEQNSDALLRLKEKIQRQKQRSPSYDKSMSQKLSHREDELVTTMTNNFDGDHDKPLMRKTAHGPAAPKYKGFSTAETRIRTPDGKVWKDGEPNQPFIPQKSFQPEKRPKAVSSLFKNSENGKFIKPPLTSGRLRNHPNSSRQNKSKNQKPTRKTGKIRQEDPLHKKSLITPSSWREGQRIAESILGPPPKKVLARDASRPDSPPTRDTDANQTTMTKKPPSRSITNKKADIGNANSFASAASKPTTADPANARKIDKPVTMADVDTTNNDGGMSQQKKMSSSIKATIPTDKLSVEARGVLDDLHLSSSESESDEEDDKVGRDGGDSEKMTKRTRGRQRRPVKHALNTDAKESKIEKMQKTRHYNQEEVQEYIAKQKAERKRRQSQERKANKDAQARKQKQLNELYRRQKESARAKKKSLELEARSRPLKQVDLAAVQVMQKMDGILDETNDTNEKENESDKENMDRQPLAKFDERMSAFMDKLNQYQSTVPPTRTYIPQSNEPEQWPTASGPPPRSDTASEFMQKLDRYLKDDTPVTAVSKYSNTFRPQTSEPVDTNEANLTVEDLGFSAETSLRRPETVPSYRDRYGDPAGTYSPRYRQMMSVDQPSNEDYLKQKSRAERRAALKAKAESLQERIQTDTKLLSEQPIVPIQPRLEEIDAILAKSGHGQSLPIHAWSPETNKNDFRDSRWQRSGHFGGVDVPDTSHSARGGLSDISPSQLPGVAGLRQHVTDMEKHKAETDAALKIQSNYRGHSVRQAMDDWKLPSGRSMTEVRRHAATLPSGANSEDKMENDDISEGPLSSRSDSLVPNTPIKLRSVEEILKEMKSREYCVADPKPLDDLASRKWTDDVVDDNNMERDDTEPKADFLSDFGSRLITGRYPENDDIYPPTQADIDKPPWERTGGDKYSVVNVFTNKYLKALKKKEKEKQKEERPKSASETSLKDTKGVPEDVPQRKSYSEHISSKKSPKNKITEKYSPRFDDTSHDATESLSSIGEDVHQSYSSISPRNSDLMQLKSDAQKKSQTHSPYTSPSELLVGKVSYSSDSESIDDKKDSLSIQNPHQHAVLSGAMSFQDENSLSLERSHEHPAPMPTTTIFPKSRISNEAAEKKFSPAALEQKMSAELNYQEAIEESLRHLTGVERTQGVSQAQQETVSLAQLLKARHLQHEVEMERLTIKAKEEALEAEKKKTVARIEEEDKRAEENLKMQEASRKALETQAEAARSSAQAAKHLAYALKHDPVPDRRFQDSFSTNSKSYSHSSSISSARTREPVSGNSSDSYDRMPPKKDDKSRQQIPKTKTLPKHSPPMSEHSTTSVRLSDNDTASSIPEQMPSTEDEDREYKKLDLGQKNVSDSSTLTKSIEEDLAFSHKKSNRVDDSDRSISEDIADQSIDSEIRTKGSNSKRKSTESKDNHSDSSETSVHFDESLTEDERAEISRRVVVPSESHRRHQRRRGTGSLDRSDVSSDDQPSSARQKTPRGGAAVKGLDDFTIGSSLSGAADSEFVHFMDQMVKQYMVEEQVRAKHQAAMLKLRERAIKEKSETELSCLEQMKKQVRNKGEDDKMPPIKKKQRAILLRLKLETDEIKKLRAVTKVASKERKLFLQQHKENAARRAKLRATEEKLDIDGELGKPRSRSDEKLKEPHLTSSTPIPNANLSDLDDISESNSELDISSTSSVLMKKLKKQIPGAIDQQRLTKREQRLVQRKKQAEQLIAWKKRLDKEEKKVYDIEKQALSAWEKEAGSKSDKNRHTKPGDSPDKESKEKEKNLGSPKTDSSQEVSSSVKSPDSDHHSSPPPPSHSESSIAEEILQINTSETNSSVSAVSPDQPEESKRSPEESSDGTNADDYSQSFESVTATQHTPRSPKSKDTETKTEKKSENMVAKKQKDKLDSNAKDVNSPSSTPLLPPRSKAGESKNATTSSKTGDKDKTKSDRRESVESWSDESFSQTQSETEQSDIECRVRALKEELKRRRMIAERLKKEQKRRHKDRLKAQEASLRSQIEAYDVFIRKTQNELTHELDHQMSAATASGNNHLPVSKPQIRSPRKSDQARHNARGVRATTMTAVSPEASPRSGSHRTPTILGKHRTESESSGKSSRSLSFDDEEKADDITPNGSTKSFPGVVAPLPSKHPDRLPAPLGTAPPQHHDSLSSGASTPTEKRFEKPKKLDLTDAATTLSKLSKPLSPNGFTPTTSSAEKSKSFIPVASKTSPKSLSLSAKTPPSPGLHTSSKLSPIQQAKKSLIPLPISTPSLDSSVSLSQKSKDKTATSPPSPLASEKSIGAYSEDFDSSAASKKTRDESVTTDDDISEHFSSASTATSGDKSDKSGTMFDLASLDKPKESFIINKDDTLHGVEDLADIGDKAEEEDDDDDDDEKTPVISPAQTPIPSSPRTPTPDFREPSKNLGVIQFNIGDRVLLAGRETGVVRFVGETSFAPGIWVGAELQNANGKNDGSVNGERYFMCAPKHGIFAPFARVSLLSPKSQSTASAKSTSLHFEYEDDMSKSHVSDDEKLTSESDLSKAISDAAKNFEVFAKDVDKDLVSPDAEKPAKTGLDRNRLADELSDKLLNSLLEDSVTSILGSHADKRLRQSQSQEEGADSKKRKKEDAVDTASSDEEVMLSASTKQLLEMLASSPDQAEAVVEEEQDENVKPKDHESLADTFTGDLLKDTLNKVLEIRRQRAKKWREMGVDESEFRHREDYKLDDGHEVEDILDAKRKLGTDEDPLEDKESTTPVRPVSPIFGAGQEDEWMFDDDIGLSSFHKKKPVINKEDNEGAFDDEDEWKDGRLVEVLSGRLEPLPPPPKFVVPHKPHHIMRLVEDATDYYYSKYLRGELISDVRIPDFLYNDKDDELSEKEDNNNSDEIDQEKKEADLNANHIFKTSLFDMVRELITEIYSSKTASDELSKRPLWLKKKTISRPSYCRRIPKNAEELLTVVSQQVNKLLNLDGDANKIDPKITMKWGSRKKKDKVDLILIQELREEEPEWTNYDEDETTVKMQLTDTVLDMLLSDTIKCLDKVEQKRGPVASVAIPTGQDSPDAEERSQ